MKHFIAIFILYLFIFLCDCASTTVDDKIPSTTLAQAMGKEIFSVDKEISWLSTRDNWIVNTYQPEVIRILRGVNICGMEFDQNEFGKALVDIIADHWKVNIVRLPISQDKWLENENGSYREKLKNIVHWLKAKKIYSLIDLHWYNGALQELPNEKSIRMWREIAELFKNEPAVLYDLFNEPQGVYPAEQWDPPIAMAWHEWAVKLTDAIRAIHPKSLIFISGIQWGQDLRYFMKNPIERENLVYSTHIYPMKFGAGVKFPEAHDVYWGDILKISKPLFIGEFGPGEPEFNDIDRINSWLSPLLERFDTMKLGWAAWSWHCNPKLTENRDPDKRSLFGEAVYQKLENPPTF